MSELRKQLQDVKEQYRSARYPGNLAADVLRPQRRLVLRLFISAAAVSGIAAAVAIWMSIQPSAITSPTTIVRTVSNVPAATTQSDESISWSVPEVPSFPEGIELMPTGQALSLPSVPTFPSLSDLETEQATTTETVKEAL